MFRVLTNAFLSERRLHERRREEEPLGQGDEEFSLFERLHQPFLLWWGNPEQEFLNKLLREDIEKAIDALPETFRTVVTLADVENLSYQEIADALSVPIGTVRSRLARGRSLLQRALWQDAQDIGVTQPLRSRPREAP